MFLGRDLQWSLTSDKTLQYIDTILRDSQIILNRYFGHRAWNGRGANRGLTGHKLPEQSGLSGSKHPRLRLHAPVSAHSSIRPNGVLQGAGRSGAEGS